MLRIPAAGLYRGLLMRWYMTGIFIIIISLSTPCAPSHAADPQKPPARSAERFPALDWLIGEWQGYGVFTDKNTYIHRSYRYDTAGMFLIERTIDMFPPDTLTTEFEVHQGFAVYYVDTISNSIKAKTFFVESYVQSSTVTIHDNGQRIVAESTEVENGPPGMRARFTIEKQGKDGFKELFELAMPAQDYERMEELVMKRIK